MRLIDKIPDGLNDRDRSALLSDIMYDVLDKCMWTVLAEGGVIEGDPKYADLVHELADKESDYVLSLVKLK